MANRSFPLPPTKGLSKPMQQWLTEVHRRFSEKGNQVITAASAVDVDATHVDISVASGTYAITLAAPTIPGIVKIIEATDVSGTSITMALTNCTGGSAATTCTWNSTGDILMLVSANNKWVIYKELGVSLT